jgi:hypothetical protein
LSNKIIKKSAGISKRTGLQDLFWEQEASSLTIMEAVLVTGSLLFFIGIFAGFYHKPPISGM